MSLLNIMMDLKKCCNHPYLFPVAAVVGPRACPVATVVATRDHHGQGVRLPSWVPFAHRAECAWLPRCPWLRWQGLSPQPSPSMRT